MADQKKREGEENKPPNPNPDHPGNPKSAEQIKKNKKRCRSRNRRGRIICASKTRRNARKRTGQPP